MALALLALAACGGGGGSAPGASGGGGSGDGNGPVYVVGDGASLPAGATRVAQLTDVPWSRLPVGSTVIVSSGQYGGPVTISAQGSADQPITVRADDDAHPPVLTEGLDFQQSAWVRVSHLVVRSPSFAGFTIRNGSHHLSLTSNTVLGAPMGVNITNDDTGIVGATLPTGTGHVIAYNDIEDSSTNGIGIDGVNADASDPTLLAHNTVLRSGHHGMEVRGSNYQIEHNVVGFSGQAIGGTSGIHIFSRGAGDDAGDGNLVRYNYSHDNADTHASDGNGIEIDQWCDHNTVAFNVAWNNDGAGIIIFDGNANQVYANTVAGNGLDPAGSHGALGELIVNGEGQAGRPGGNQVFDNLMVATSPDVPALYADSRAVQAGNTVGPNLLFNTTGNRVLRWTDDRIIGDEAGINAATGVIGNRVILPAFADATQPAADGLRLTAFPGATGLPLAGQTDLLGQAPFEGAAYFGAYFTSP